MLFYYKMLLAVLCLYRSGEGNVAANYTGNVFGFQRNLCLEHGSKLTDIIDVIFNEREGR